jgi:Mg/Co/Ni transporter MgtE
MEPDNAADLINEIDQDRRLPILERLPDVQRRRSVNCSPTAPTPRAAS